MSKDPAFLFYPGDYLRDTQCLSESVQVAYDRIMCEHMRNICISKKQLKFFTKRLNEEEVEELETVLTEIEGGFQITWVAESIVKRKKYSESRRNNRKGKNKIISKSYVPHMENENEIEDIVESSILNEKERKLLIGHLLSSYEWKAASMRSIASDTKKGVTLKVEQFDEWIVSAVDHLNSSNEADKPHKDVQRHAYNWIKIQVQKTGSPSVPMGAFESATKRAEDVKENLKKLRQDG